MRISLRGMLIITLLIAAGCWTASIFMRQDDSPRRLNQLLDRERLMVEQQEEAARQLRVQLTAGLLSVRKSPSQFFLDAKAEHDRLPRLGSP